jgi:hypothetical protein
MGSYTAYLWTDRGITGMKQGRTKSSLREEAKLAMWTYYSEHKAWMPEWVREYREAIISGIESGQTAEEVFNTIIERVEKELAELEAA